MAQAARRHGNGPMIVVEKKLIPAEILKDPVLLHLAAAYFSIGKRLEQKTQCSQTRGFVLSTLRGGAVLNQNQIATVLGFDRTVVHRCIRSMILEGFRKKGKLRKSPSRPVDSERHALQGVSDQSAAGSAGEASQRIDLGRVRHPCSTS